ncbi:hypothetical protein [Nonomuraea aurantiaca]|uniref:hypothetical protein n=1 Tax=Nonomuraea aurantiaca TaxID=2878562 RepID=UPI001CD9EF64|nr:hypothetical protein [Nonomuraea aurantiaca]MCA2230158.1 hypothetical protein [Nonomuraea aurantiaca]
MNHFTPSSPAEHMAKSADLLPLSTAFRPEMARATNGVGAGRTEWADDTHVGCAPMLAAVE